MEYTPGRTRINAQGWTVRAQAQKAIRPAVDRFFDHIAEVDCGMPDPCWLWQAGPLFRVNDFTLMRPWKFIYELMECRRVPQGAGWRWKCANEGQCCHPEHLEYKGDYCKERTL